MKKKSFLNTFKALLAPHGQEIDPTIFNDEYALKTEWLPLKRGGSSIRTHNFQRLSQQRLRFEVSGWVKGLNAVTAAFLVFISFFFIGDHMANNDILLQQNDWYMISASLIIGILFWYLSGWFVKPRSFDKNFGYYWRGQPTGKTQNPRHKGDDLTRLSDVYALQILYEVITTDKTSYKSYELNLVLRNHSRVNVLDHGDYKELSQNAKTIAEFLNVPIWDAVAAQKCQTEN